MIEYSDDGKQADQGEATTRDLRVLAARVGRGDADSVAIAVRLVRTTPAGANLEDLYSMLGGAAGDSAEQFLSAIQREGDGRACPGVAFLGAKFVDNDPARVAELDRRRRAITKVSSGRLIPVRNLCLKELQHDS